MLTLSKEDRTWIRRLIREELRRQREEIRDDHALILNEALRAEAQTAMLHAMTQDHAKPDLAS